LPAHLDRAIVSAETYGERDRLYRRMASHCYQTAHWFEKTGDFKQALKWMNLALRFLQLSLNPKNREMDEKFERELDELEPKIKAQKAEVPG
jgi:hypothetical protein